MPRLETEVPGTPSDRFGGLAEVLAMLERAGAPCLVFGGWAEERLELRAPGPHGDIDLVHLNDSFATIDIGFRRGRLPEEIRAKRFPHKRAFAWRGLCCEILLVQDWCARPASWFWGDIPLFWQAPIAHVEAVIRGGTPIQRGFGSQPSALPGAPSRHPAGALANLPV